MADYRILCFGDSITQGALDTEGGWADRLKRSLAEREQEEPANRYQVYNLGIGGNTSEDLAKRIQHETAARESTDWQDVFVIAIGINDSRFNSDFKRIEVSLDQYKSNLQQIVGAVQEFSAKIYFIGLTPVAEDGAGESVPFKNNEYNNRDVEAYDKALSEVAKDLRVPKLEIFSQARNDSIFMGSLRIDKLHPDSIGHKWLHKRIESFLLDMLEV